ncbi:MAG: hypothetical protein ACJKTH_00705 [Patescibacteria group bacterium UBA2163]
MMKKIINIWNTILEFGTPSPIRDWYGLLGIVVVLVLIVSLIAVNFFFTFKADGVNDVLSGDAAPTPRMPRTELQEVLETYERRETNYEAGNVQRPEMNDPS